MADDRRQDSTQKDLRYMEVKILDIQTANDGVVEEITYSYVANPAKKDTYENRDPLAQERYLNLRKLKAGQYYDVCVVNVGSEKRAKWIWIQANPVTQKMAMMIFKVRERKRPSRNVEIPAVVMRVMNYVGEVADDAYAVWKRNNPDVEPAPYELLWQVSAMKDKIGVTVRQQATSLLKQLLAEIEEQDLKKDLLDFKGDDNGRQIQPGPDGSKGNKKAN